MTSSITLVGLFVAFIFGALIGAERQFRQRSAGPRTNVLVAVGAAAFAERLTGADGAVRLIAYVVFSIGFLGAGARAMCIGLTMAELAVEHLQTAAAECNLVSCCVSTVLVATAFVAASRLAGRATSCPLWMEPFLDRRAPGFTKTPGIKGRHD